MSLPKDQAVHKEKQTPATSRSTIRTGNLYTQQQIEKTFAAPFPFILVDKIIELTDTQIVGIKNVTFNEYFFQGTLSRQPGNAGVLQIEAWRKPADCFASMPCPMGNTTPIS